MSNLGRPVIAVDLCNTICDVNASLEYIFSTRRRRGSMYIEGVTEYFFKENPEFFLYPKVFPYAAEVLQMLSVQFDITYLTARPPEAHLATMQFLFQHNFPEGELIHSSNKTEVFLNRNMSFAFDDAPKEIASYTEKNIPVFVKKWDYNEGMGIRFEWEEMYQFLTYGEFVPKYRKIARY